MLNPTLLGWTAGSNAPQAMDLSLAMTVALQLLGLGCEPWELSTPDLLSAFAQSWPRTEGVNGPYDTAVSRPTGYAGRRFCNSSVRRGLT
jgi:hypothetical protein